MATKSQIAVYDFTLKADACSVDDLKAFLKEWAKKWVFQKEQGDSGFVHYQGRLSLIKKRRLQELIAAVSLNQPWPFHWSASSTNSLSDESFYCIKADTRIEGPWKDNDVIQYIPRQVREIEALRPWQQYIVDTHDVWDTRHINILVDVSGNNGKTTLKSYLRAHGIGRCLPFFNDYKEIMQIVMDTPTSRLYVIDLPRSLRKDQMYGFFAGIESLKDGYAFDTRYHFKEKLFDCPNIWIFTNKMPDTEYLSIDRWQFWKIENDMLVPYM